MFKKILSLSLAALMIAGTLCACQPAQQPDDPQGESGWYGFTETKPLAESTVVSTIASQIEITGDPAALKIGVVLVGDENEGYTLAHMEGIRKACEQLGINPDTQVIWKYNITEDSKCYDNCIDCVNSGCQIVFTNSYGHQPFAQQAASEHPEVSFVAATGDTAAAAGLSNFSNAFTAIYESRYVSGVVAGMKLKELVENGTLTKEKLPNSFDANGNIKIGYVGAFPYAEVVSGYTAFYLGIKSIISNVTMEVRYTSKWFDLIGENTTAKALIEQGCVIIGQHADSTGAPSACQEAFSQGKLVYSIGYNVDMLNVAPDAALTSSTNNWGVFYAYAMATAINGGKLATNWAAGYSADAVGITTLGSSCAPGTAEAVANVEAQLKAGTLHVFDVSKFTVGGKNITWSYATDSNGDFTYDCNNAVADGYYHESYIQSAPSFTLRIDGIIEG